MSLGLIGKKIGMTRIFLKNGNSIPITVISVPKNRVVQIKNIKNDGYNAIQTTFGIKKKNNNKSLLGHYLKFKLKIGLILKEFKVKEDFFLKNLIKIGDKITVKLFNIGDKVDIRGKTIGKGFSGVIKRYHFSSGRASHGNSKAHNTPGSVGMSQDPGRVFRGKRMSGQLGFKYKTIQNLKILRIDSIRNLLFISGSIPGCKNNYVTILPSVKFIPKLI
ncbi:50S ribosomal protein L3 [Candidatus Zinderia endosymbiont of Aphrophora alni]|uniref:50S ribosomal protein L3 n=1 Tax=Candidatus Zinderia endosymbiont of Aphrophora alni TaxID=3077951 RepID=UPI0030CD1227